MPGDWSWVWDHFDHGDKKAGNNKTHFQTWCKYCINDCVKRLNREDKGCISQGLINFLRTEVALKQDGKCHSSQIKHCSLT